MILIQIRTTDTGGLPVKSYVAVRGQESLDLGSEPEFLSLVGASHHELSDAIIGNPRREYVQANMARWTAKQLKIKYTQLWYTLKELRPTS